MTVPDTWLLCKRCSHGLTSMDQAVEMAGRQVHEVVNPAGFEFSLGCFATAPGCVAAGESSDEASWFPGFTWQRAFCKQCSWHVGWLFRSKTMTFFGLDLARAQAPP